MRRIYGGNIYLTQPAHAGGLNPAPYERGGPDRRARLRIGRISTGVARQTAARPKWAGDPNRARAFKPHAGTQPGHEHELAGCCTHRTRARVPVKTYCEKEPETVGARILTTGCHSRHTTQGPRRPGEQRPSGGGFFLSIPVRPTGRILPAMPDHL